MGYESVGRRVLVTGASSGIGRETALILAAKGARVCLLARNRQRLDRLALQIVAEGGAAPLVVESDLSVRGNASSAARHIIEQWGGVDVLINNAGGAVGGSVWAVADGDAARADFEVDVWSPLAFIGAFVPGMRQRQDGTVVNVTSVRQVITWPSFGQNSGAQAALAQITETLRLELLADGVHVVEVIPGPVETAMQGPTRLLPGITEAFHDRLGVATPQEVAEAIMEAIELGTDRVFCPAESGRRLYEDPTAARAQIVEDVRRMVTQQDRNPEIDTFVIEADHPLILAARAQWEEAHQGATQSQDPA
jgi:uncharacterized protein